MDVEDGDASQPTAALLTITEAAERLGLTRWTIRGWIASGTLPTTRIGRHPCVWPDALRAAQTLMHVGDVVPAWRREPRRAGWRLRQLREAAELTQIELAARSGLTHEAISNLERGRRAPLATTIRALAKALGVAPAQFVAGSATERGLTTAEAAVRLGVPPGRVQTWLLGGQLAGWKVSGQWRVATRSVTELEASGRMRGRSRRLDPRFHG
jgi:excisionase family DNA binding protein